MSRDIAFSCCHCRQHLYPEHTPFVFSSQRTWSAAASGKLTEAVQLNLSNALQQVSSVACSATLKEFARPDTLQKLQQAASDISAVQQLSSSGAAGASSTIVGAFSRALGSLGQCVEALHDSEIVSLKLNVQQLQGQVQQLQGQVQQMQEHHDQQMQGQMQKPLQEADIMRKYGDWVALLCEQVAYDIANLEQIELGWTGLSEKLRWEGKEHKHLKWTKGHWHKKLLDILSNMSLTKDDWVLLRTFANDRNTRAHYHELQNAAYGDSDEGPHLTEEDLQGIDMLSAEFDQYKPVLRKAVAIVAQSYGWKS